MVWEGRYDSRPIFSYQHSVLDVWFYWHNRRWHRIFQYIKISPFHWVKKTLSKNTTKRERDTVLHVVYQTPAKAGVNETMTHKHHWALVAFFERVNKFMLFEIGWEESETDSKKVQRKQSTCDRDSSYQFMTTSTI